MISDLLQTLTFLRPAWLLGLPLIPLWLWWLLRQPPRHGWQGVIPPLLLQPLIASDNPPRVQQRNRAAAWLSAVLALALLTLSGPSWQTREQPGAPVSDALVIVLDVSLSMLGTDVEPDRLTLAKRKIQDILRLRQGAETALVAYAGDAHTVTPLTRDGRTIAAFLPALDPFMMPAYGGRADLGVGRAVQLLETSPAEHRRILLITDGVRERWHDRLQQFIADSGHPLAILAVGTEQGSTISLGDRGVIREDGQPVIVRTELDVLRPLASADRIHRITPDDRDLEYLGVHPRTSGTAEGTDEDTVTVREDGGYWLLFALIPLILLAWRRNALHALAPALLASVMLTASPSVSWAATLSTLFYNADQRGKALLSEDPGAAARAFGSAEWKAVAHYRAGQYEEAIELWRRWDERDAHFNRGNALARSGQLERAIRAYEAALEHDSDFTEAQENRDLVKSLLDQKEAEEDTGDSSQRGEDDPDTEPVDEGASRAPAGETDEGPREYPVPETDRDARDWDQQRHEQWLRRVPMDPAHLLKRKFEHEFQQRQRQPNAGDTDELW